VEVLRFLTAGGDLATLGVLVFLVTEVKNIKRDLSRLEDKC
jgi:hypothetical protein